VGRADLLPVARLAENLARHVEQHPSDADALYALGRVHAWAFCYELEAHRGVVR
jgi:hypothetical protein